MTEIAPEVDAELDRLLAAASERERFRHAVGDLWDQAYLMGHGDAEAMQAHSQAVGRGPLPRAGTNRCACEHLLLTHGIDGRCMGTDKDGHRCPCTAPHSEGGHGG